MKNTLGRIILLVDDYEQSAAFYEENFGFSRVFDVTTDVGQRFLHLGHQGEDNAGIWFLKAEDKAQRERIGNQTAGQPTLVIYTSNLQELYGRLKNKGVKIKTEPVISPDYSFLHCFDHDGNEIVVVELKPS